MSTHSENPRRDHQFDNTKRARGPLQLALWCLGLCLFLNSCQRSCQPVNPPTPPGPAQAIKLADWQANGAQVAAFALQLYDDSRKPRDLRWIDDPALVKRFIDSIPTNQGSNRQINQDLTQATFVRTKDGKTFRFDLIDIAKGQPGFASFLDGTIPTSPDLQGVIAQAYNQPDYNSSKEKQKEKETPQGTGAQPFTEETLVPEPTNPCERLTEITLVVYQDDPGKDFLKKFADAKAANPNTEAFEAKGVNSLVNKLRLLRGQCKCVKTLIMAVHGSPGSFRLGPKDTPYESATRVGLHPNQTTPTSFGQQIKPYLCRNAAIRLFSCDTARNDGTPETNGPKALQDIADASGASVSASDKEVNWSNNQPSTQGNIMTATPGGGSPTVTSAAPAGNLP